MHSHHSWVRCRLAAEFCRSALATWGLPRAAPLLQDFDLAGARGLTRALYILHTRWSAARPVPIEEFKRIYLEKRIDDQLAYYDRQVDRAYPLYRRLAATFSITTVLRAGQHGVLCAPPHAAPRHTGVDLGNNRRVPADRAAGSGGRGDLDHFDQRPAAPSSALPGYAGPARGPVVRRLPPAGPGTASSASC